LPSLKNRILDLAKSTSNDVNLNAVPCALDDTSSYPFLIGYAWLPLGGIVPVEAWVDLVTSSALRPSHVAQLSEFKQATGFHACGIRQAMSMVVPNSWTVTELFTAPSTPTGSGQLPMLSSNILQLSPQEISGYEDLYSGLDEDNSCLSTDSTSTLLESLEVLRHSRQRCLIIDGLGILNEALVGIRLMFDERARICQKLEENMDKETFVHRMNGLMEKLSKSKILVALYKGMQNSPLLPYSTKNYVSLTSITFRRSST
jgi:hypothetical protein